MVFDDAVVNDRISIAGSVGVSIRGAGLTMSGPTGVCNPYTANYGLLGLRCLKLCNFTKRLVQLEITIVIN
jgi:hypothetical protein